MLKISKKTRVRVRRWLWLASLAIGCACAFKGPELLLHCILNGYEQARLAVAVLGTAGACVGFCEWLARGGL